MARVTEITSFVTEVTVTQPLTVTEYSSGDPMGSGGVSNHAALTGLAGDDHPQYHTDERGDDRYSQIGHAHSADAITYLGEVGEGILKVTDGESGFGEFQTERIVVNADYSFAPVIWSNDPLVKVTRAPAAEAGRSYVHLGFTGTESQVGLANGGHITFSSDENDSDDTRVAGVRHVTAAQVAVSNGGAGYGSLLIGDGEQDTPALAFGEQPNTGFFRPSNNRIGVVTNGSMRAVFVGQNFVLERDGIIGFANSPSPGTNDDAGIGRLGEGRLKIVNGDEPTHQLEIAVTGPGEGYIGGIGEKLAFYGASPVSRQAAISDASGGGTVDNESRAAIGAILSVLRNLNLIET